MFRSFEDYSVYLSELRSSTQWLSHTFIVVALIGLSLILCRSFVMSLRENAAFRSIPLPPGPKDAWFNPGPLAPIRYTKMIELYGPVFSFKQGKNIFIVVGQHKAAVDIMQKHGADMADRPQMVAANDIVSAGMRILVTPAGERLRRLRRALHSQLQPSVAPQWLPLQFKNAKTLILDIIHEPDQHIDHAKRFAASLIMSMTYGKTSPTHYSDQEVQEILRNNARLGSVMNLGVSSHIVDIYPILRYFPWITSELRRWHRDELDLFTRQVDAARKQMAASSTQPSFVSYLLKHQDELGLSDNELAYLAGSMFGAGSHTTASAISFIIMAAATHPEEQAEVQAELDTIIGRDKVPSYQDVDSLPRMVAFCLEAFRWRPTAWGGFPHRATKDIFWNDYVIPAGATIIGNTWAIGLDSDVYPDPAAFKPDRWLDDKGQIREDLVFPTFGFGRRVCPGQVLANNSVFLTTMLLLWAFNIAEDPSTPIDTMGFADVLNISPYPFKASFEPRIKNLEELITSASLN